MALIKCKECGNEISNKADSCPRCGSKVKQSTISGTIGWVIGGLFVFIYALGMILPNQSSDSNFETLTSNADEFKTTAEEISEEYESNSVSADNKFKNRRFEVSGEIVEIRTDFMDHAVIVLKGGTNQFLEPQFVLDDSEKEKAADLIKGLPIELSCVGAGDIVKAPMNKDCYIK